MIDQIIIFVMDLYKSPLVLAAFLGTIIGLERELAGKDPSLRTFGLISLGSCMFAMLSSTVAATGLANGDPGRIGAQIIPGIGFLGAGTIFRSHKGVSGLTTAALMWVTAAIGMAVGYNQNEEAIRTTVVAVTLTVVLSIVHRFVKRYSRRDVGKDIRVSDVD